MSDRIDILLSNLQLDFQNPRLPQIYSSHREALRSMLRLQGPKIIRLAKHIAKHGVNFATLPIVMPADANWYTVLDGNRRLTALRVLETPELAAKALPPSQVKTLSRLSTEYQKHAVETLLCLVFESREEADPWIQLQHRGEVGGAGVVPWDGEAGARYDSRRGDPTPHLDILNLIKDQPDLDSNLRAKLDTFPITTLDRLIRDPDVRSRLGIDIAKGVIYTRYPAKEVLKGLTRIASDIALKEITVSDVKRKEDRLRYIGDLPTSSLPDINTVGERRQLQSADEDIHGQEQTGTPEETPKTDGIRKRRTLVPAETSISISRKRAEALFSEMKKLSAFNHTNIAAIILRVFVEWSIDAYIDSKALDTTLTPAQERSLSKRTIFIVEKLVSDGDITKNQAKPLLVELHKPHSLFSIDTLNAYVHNTDLSPHPQDLLSTWDHLQRMIIQIWDQIQE